MYVSLTHNVDYDDLAAAMAGLEPESAERFGRMLGNAIDFEAGEHVFLAFVKGLTGARDELYEPEEPEAAGPLKSDANPEGSE